MVIQCPECNTQYDLNEDRLGTAGKMVRCVRCRNTFFASPALAKSEVPPTIEASEPAEAVEAPAEDSSVEDAFDFTSITPAQESTPELDPEDGYADGFVTELNEEDELVSEVDLNSLEADDEITDPLSDIDEVVDELETDLPVVEAPAKRSPMSTVLLLILLLLLALIAGTVYLMVTDGADAPIKLLEQLLS